MQHDLSESRQKKRKPSKPLIEPAGWGDLAPLVAARRKLGFRLGDISAAMSIHYDVCGKLERGVSPVSPKMCERYREALARLVAAKK